MSSENSFPIDQFVAHFVDAIDGTDLEAINATTHLRDIPEWDSLAVLLTITMVDTQYQIELTGEDLIGCQTLGELIKLVSARRVS